GPLRKPQALKADSLAIFEKPVEPLKIDIEEKDFKKGNSKPSNNESLLPLPQGRAISKPQGSVKKKSAFSTIRGKRKSFFGGVGGVEAVVPDVADDGSESGGKNARPFWKRKEKDIDIDQ